MAEIDLCKLKIQPERDHRQQIERFRKSGMLRLRAVAPKGVIGKKAMTGWLDLKLSNKTAWFYDDVGDEPDEPSSEAEWRSCGGIMLTIAMLVLPFFYDQCDGLLSPDSPSCEGMSILTFPFFYIPLGVGLFAFGWAGRQSKPVRRFSKSEARVKVPAEVWTLLGSFSEAIEHAKSPDKAPLGERAVRFGAEKVAGKIGEVISGPMIGATFEMLTEKATDDDQSRIDEAMELVRGNMVDAVLAQCRSNVTGKRD